MLGGEIIKNEEKQGKLVLFLEKLFPFVVALRKKRQIAINTAEGYYEALKNDILMASNGINREYSHEGDERNNYIISHEPIKYFDTIFMSSNYKDFVKYGFLVKKYQKKIDNFFKVGLAIIIILTILLYLITKSITAATIVFIGLFIILAVITKLLLYGKSYVTFYNDHIYDLIFSILPGYTVTYDGVNIDFSKETLRELVKFKFDRYKMSDQLAFASDAIDGNLFNMTVERDTEIRDKNGNVRTTTNKVFDGFNITLNYKQSFGFLKGAIIKIRDDDNALSALTEDTIQSMAQSDKEFMFNSEELNKAFDCFIEGVNSFGDIDDLMERIHMVITPVFEEQLLFLRKRYNTFNMTITDTMLNFNVNMRKSSYQRVKSDDKITWKTKYRDHIKLFKLPISGDVGANDFMLYKMFPPAEKLFFIMYFDNFMRTYLNSEGIKAENFDLLKSFETTDLEIADSFYSEFKKKYKEEIEFIYKEAKTMDIHLEGEVK